MLKDLQAIYDTRRSFYGKAQIALDADADTVTLYSCGTKIATVIAGPTGEDLSVTKFWDYSATTLRHLQEFIKQFAREFANSCSKNEIAHAIEMQQITLED